MKTHVFLVSTGLQEKEFLKAKKRAVGQNYHIMCFMIFQAPGQALTSWDVLTGVNNQLRRLRLPVMMITSVRRALNGLQREGYIEQGPKVVSKKTMVKNITWYCSVERCSGLEHLYEDLSLRPDRSCERVLNCKFCGSPMPKHKRLDAKYCSEKCRLDAFKKIHQA